MIGKFAKDAEWNPVADPSGYTRAILNILTDFGEEKARLQDTQKAVLNILEDAGAEKLKLEDAQKAMLNILEDFDAQKNKIEWVNREMAGEIAERKRVEEALEAFSYSVSHDLRAPLRGIDGFSQALLEDYAGKLDDTGNDYLRRVRAATQKMGRLIDDLLQLSRVTRSVLHQQRVDLTALAHAAIEDLRDRYPQRSVDVIIERNLTAECDQGLVRVVLDNLLGNAWKYTSKKKHARIEFSSLMRDGVRTFFVQDDGAGFDMAYAGKLFGAFQRLHSVDEFEGTGIGLATVQRIIHRHGGQIWAEGVLNQGATFYFTLEPLNEQGWDYAQKDYLVGGGQPRRRTVDPACT